MKKILLSAIQLLVYFHSFCQYTPTEWVIGQGGGNPYNNQKMTFNNGTMFIQFLNGINNGLGWTNGAITDSSHPLLFYTNGGRVWNYTHNIIQNGDSLSPCAYTYMNMVSLGLMLPQTAVFIPDPGDTNKFYLFHASADLHYADSVWGLGYYPGKVYYSVIDKTLDSGNGAAISKNNLILNDTVGIGFLAVKHGNGRDWWIFIRHNHKPIFYRWLITPTGVLGPFSQSIGPIAYSGFYNLKFDPLVNKVACSREYFVFPVTRYFDLYDFDRCTGLFANPQTLTINNAANFPHAGGCEFSPSGRYLYAGTITELHQFDMLAANIAASDIIVDSADSITLNNGGGTYGMMQLGPDGKIYCCSNASSNTFLNVINYPDSAGVACNAVKRGVVLPSVHYNDLPNIPLYNLGPLYGSSCDSLSAGINELEIKHQLIVYPNPASFELNIILPAAVNNSSIEIYNATGNRVKFIERIKNNSCKIQINDLANGLYILKSNSGNNSIVKFQVIK